MRRSLCLVALCATLSGCGKTVWQDFTGSGRGPAELQMDSASCQLDSQSAAQTDSSQCQKAGCFIAVAIGNAASQVNAFNLCMQSHGWQQVKVAAAGQAETQFKSALTEAIRPCNATARSAYPEDATKADIAKGLVTPTEGELGKVIDCVTDQQRPVWAKYHPEFLDLYDAFRAKVAVDAEDYDNGDISYKEYRAETKQQDVDFGNDIRERRAGGERVESQHTARYEDDSENDSGGDPKPVHLNHETRLKKIQAAKAELADCKTPHECRAARRTLKKLTAKKEKKS
jgi:hypothetical protein